CGPSATLSGNAPQGSNTGTWSLVQGAGVIQNINSPVTLVSNLGTGDNIFQWSIGNGICPAGTSQVTITRFDPPSEALAGEDKQTCATSTELTAVPPVTGAGFWFIISGTGNIADPQVPLTTVTGLAPGENIIVWSVTN